MEAGISPDSAELLGALGHAVIATDLDGVVLHWNAAAERMYGWNAAEAVGRQVAALLVPDLCREAGAEIFAVLRRGETWSGGFLVRRKDGSRFPVLVTDSGVYHRGALTAIVGVSTHLGAAVAPLLERSSDAALVLRADGVLSYVSPAVTSLFGWSVEEVLGGPIVPLLHPQDHGVLSDFLAALTSTAAERPRTVDLRVRRHDDWVWVEASLMNLLDDPVVRGVVCNLRISARREALRAAEQRARQLEGALESRVLIEQAKGFLACRFDVDVDDAFAAMRSYARSHNAALQDVAARVVREQLDPGLGRA